MKCACLSLFLDLCCLTVFCSWTIPRLSLRQDDLYHQIPYKTNLSHTVFYKQVGSEVLFVGGTNYVQKLDANDGNILETFTLPANADPHCKDSCENVVTVIEELENYLLVCGTNGGQPKCWKLYPNETNRTSVIVGSFDGTGISPPTPSHNSLALVVDGDLYAAAPLYMDGTSLQFRRNAGNRNNMWMYDPWIDEPIFISAFFAKRNNDTINEKIYVLYQEKNPDASPEADPWLSTVGRVCKADQGGPKILFQNIWTSFLKARLVCSIASESLYFNRLQDAFILQSDHWKDSRVYALFSSRWNSTAICIYSLAELDSVFENSNFRGYSDDIPSPRPGTCVKNSMSLPIAAISIIKNNPEMTDWIHPIQKHSPFYVSNYNYTKIVVDRVQTANGKIYNVLLLATDTGLIHKILEDHSKPFVISETRLCNGPAPVQSMKLNSEKRKLYVGYPGQMSVFDIQRCEDYNTSCEDCVLARDPYCAWTEHGCTSQIGGGIQNIATGETDVCHRKTDPEAPTTKQYTSSSTPLAATLITHTVPHGFPLYLSCPIKSHHATYTWIHTGHIIPCQQTENNCLHLIPVVRPGDSGKYVCLSREHNYTQVVKKYSLKVLVEPTSRFLNSGFRLVEQKNLLLALPASVLFILHKLF